MSCRCRLMFVNTVLFVVLCVSLFGVYKVVHWEDTDLTDETGGNKPTVAAYETQIEATPYGYDMPIIFVGGMPRSGTTLMRVMLDAHGDVRCGEETRVIPNILMMRMDWDRNPIEKKRLEEGGLHDDVLDSAVRAFIVELTINHGSSAPRLAVKDPFNLGFTSYLHKLFPNGKFLLMLRDGRAVVHSIITRHITITGFDLNSYRQCLQQWSIVIREMYDQCMAVGASTCMMVQYEQLVLHPRDWMGRILEFLQLPWDEAVMHHEEMIGRPGSAGLSKVEPSTDQVIKPVNVDALTNWVGHIPADVIRDMEKIAPMLRVLGYDPLANPPMFGEPDREVLENAINIKNNSDYWRQKEVDFLKRKTEDSSS